MLSIGVIVEQLHEKVESLFLEHGKASSYPKILIREAAVNVDMPQVFRVMVEGVEMAVCKEGFLEAVLIMFLGYYVFNIEYPMELKGTLGFVTKYLLEIRDSTVKEKKVSKFWDKVISL